MNYIPVDSNQQSNSHSTIGIYFERFLKVKKCKKRKFRQKCNFFYISWTSMQKFYEGLKSSFLDWTSNISADDQGYWSPYVSFFQLSIPDSREHVWLVLYDRENTNMNKICNWGMLLIHCLKFSLPSNSVHQFGVLALLLNYWSRPRFGCAIKKTKYYKLTFSLVWLCPD